MKTLVSLTCLAALAALLAGCKTYGPPYDASVRTTPEEQATLLKDERQRIEALHSNEFTTVELTNLVDPAWLKPPTNLFRLGPADQLDIETLGEVDSRMQTFVGPDGKVYYSFLPGVSVWGLTLKEAREVMEKELGKYVKVQPEVSVSLRGVGSKRLWILGSVQNPGVYTLRAPMTVLEALSLAGGPTPDPTMNAGVANLDYSFLVRGGEPVRVDFAGLVRHGDFSQNIYLQADDFLYLRPGVIRNVYVLGAVRMPAVVPYRDELTLSAVMATAGGTIDYAQRGKIAVVRGSLSKPRIAMVNFSDILKGKAPDVLLEPGDIVYVPHIPGYKLIQLAERMLREFVRSIAANEGYAAAGGTGNVRPTLNSSP